MSTSVPTGSRGGMVLSVPREPIWRVANMARGKYLADLGSTVTSSTGRAGGSPSSWDRSSKW